MKGGSIKVQKSQKSSAFDVNILREALFDSDGKDKVNFEKINQHISSYLNIPFPFVLVQDVTKTIAPAFMKVKTWASLLA